MFYTHFIYDTYRRIGRRDESIFPMQAAALFSRETIYIITVSEIPYKIATKVSSKNIYKRLMTVSALFANIRNEMTLVSMFEVQQSLNCYTIILFFKRICRKSNNEVEK